jgi:hypothetical protein
MRIRYRSRTILRLTSQTDTIIDRTDISIAELARTINARDNAISAREVTAAHGNTHRRSRSNPKPSSEPASKANSTIRPLTSINALTKALDNTLPPTKVSKVTMTMTTTTTMILTKPSEL